MKLLLHANVVLRFKGVHFLGPLLGLLNLLPCPHLFLLQEGNPIGKQLGVLLNTRQSSVNIPIRSSLTLSSPWWR